MTREVVCRSYATSPNELFLTAACRNLPQLKLSRPGTCSRALRMAISDTASTTHSKLPDRRWLLPHPARDCKNQWRPAHRRESQTRPCSSRNRETDSASAHPARLFGEYLSVPAIRFDTANGKDAAARTALSALSVDRLNSSGNTCRTSLPPATSSPAGQSRCRRDKILPGYASDRRSSNRPLRTV